MTLYSHDWSDRTSWYTSSVRVADEVPTDTGDHTTYTLAHPYLIDTFHGKLTGEDYLKDANGNGYHVCVNVNGTKKTEQDPHYGTGGDFTVDYNDGKVIFLAANQPTDAVTVTYHYSTDSTFIVGPVTGTSLRIDSAEVQFSLDIGISDSVVFQPYGYVDVFAPQLMPGVPSGTKIPLGSPLVYKGISDYQNDAVKAYPTYPAIGGSSWRGMNVPMVVLDWDYQASTLLHASAGMEIRLKLQHDTPLTGTYASATFYCVSEAP